MREGRSKSTMALRHTTLRNLNQIKRSNTLRNTIYRLQQYKTAYDQPFLQRHQEVAHGAGEEDETVVPLAHLFQPDFNLRSLRLCEQVIFQLQAFAKFSKQGHRARGIMAKMHGWDEHIEEVLFPRKVELKIDINPEDMHHRLGMTGRTLKVRNLYNKLRLFLAELSQYNKRQQELESRFMQSRIGNQLGKLEGQMLAMATTKNPSKLQYLDEIGRMHDLMLNTKAKIRNKADNVRWFEQQLGRININQFYIKEQGNIKEIQNYFTTHRLKKT